jgi:hypothetical protein
MTKLTQEEIDWLATEFVGLYLHDDHWWTDAPIEENMVCHKDDFDPAENPAHGWLILKALIDKAPHRGTIQIGVCRKHTGISLGQSHGIPRGILEDDFWPAVCQAALSTKEDKK